MFPEPPTPTSTRGAWVSNCLPPHNRDLWMAGGCHEPVNINTDTDSIHCHLEPSVGTVIPPGRSLNPHPGKKACRSQLYSCEGLGVGVGWVGRSMGAQSNKRSSLPITCHKLSSAPTAQRREHLTKGRKQK